MNEVDEAKMRFEEAKHSYVLKASLLTEAESEYVRATEAYGLAGYILAQTKEDYDLSVDLMELRQKEYFEAIATKSRNGNGR